MSVVGRLVSSLRRLAKPLRMKSSQLELNRFYDSVVLQVSRPCLLIIVTMESAFHDIHLFGQTFSLIPGQYGDPMLRLLLVPIYTATLLDMPIPEPCVCPYTDTPGVYTAACFSIMSAKGNLSGDTKQQRVQEHILHENQPSVVQTCKPLTTRTGTQQTAAAAPNHYVRDVVSRLMRTDASMEESAICSLAAVSVKC